MLIMNFVSMVQISGENSKPFWRLRLGRGSVEHPLSNGEEFRDIQHSMITALDPGFHIWFIMALYYKMRQILLQNATAILLQNATEVYYKMRQRFFITKCDSFMTKCDSSYKMPRLLQIEIVQSIWILYNLPACVES